MMNTRGAVTVAGITHGGIDCGTWWPKQSVNRNTHYSLRVLCLSLSVCMCDLYSRPGKSSQYRRNRPRTEKGYRNTSEVRQEQWYRFMEEGDPVPGVGDPCSLEHQTLDTALGVSSGIM